jgi:hypothetical protein
MTSQERIDLAKQTMPMARQALDTAVAEVTAVRADISAAESQLADPNMAGPLADKLRAQLAASKARLSALLDRQGQAEQVIAMLERTIAAGPAADATLGDEMVILGQALLGGSAYVSGQAKVWMFGVGTVLTVIGGAMLRKLGTLGTAFKEVVAGGEQLKAAKPEAIGAFREAQTKTQKHESTRLLVEQAQKELAA